MPRRHAATHRTRARLTCVTIVFSGWPAAGRGVSAAPSPGGGSIPLSDPLASGLSSQTAWERIAATHSSTWKCRKLFQVYLKNRSWGKQRAQARPQTGPLLRGRWGRQRHIFPQCPLPSGRPSPRAGRHLPFYLQPATSVPFISALIWTFPKGLSFCLCYKLNSLAASLLFQCDFKRLYVP